MPPPDANPVILPAPEGRLAEVSRLGLPAELLGPAGLRFGLRGREQEVRRRRGRVRNYNYKGGLVQEGGEARQDRGKLSAARGLSYLNLLNSLSVLGMHSIDAFCLFWPRRRLDAVE